MGMKVDGKEIVLTFEFSPYELELVRQSLRNEMERQGTPSTRKVALAELRNSMSDAMLDQALKKVRVININ